MLPFKIIEYMLQDASEKKKLISIRWKWIPKMPEIFDPFLGKKYILAM